MRAFLAVVALLGLALSQQDLLPERNSDIDEALLLSRLAYAPSEFANVDPVEAARLALEKSKFDTKRTTMRTRIFPANEVEEAKRINAIDQQLTVLDATPDAVAYVRTDPATQKKTLLIGYRGTARLRDLVPDAQLAFNSRRVKRLDEARAFAARVRAKVPDIPASQIHISGHSLGGFIAEGVGNDIAGSRTISVEPGAPVFGNMKRPAAFNAPAAGAVPHTRLVRTGDPITMGDHNLNRGEVQVTEPRVSKMEPISNHLMKAYLPWLAGPSLSRKVSTSARWAASRVRARVAVAERNIVNRFKSATQQIRQRATNARQRAGAVLQRARSNIGRAGARVASRARQAASTVRQAGARAASSVRSGLNRAGNYLRRI